MKISKKELQQYANELRRKHYPNMPYVRVGIVRNCGAGGKASVWRFNIFNIQIRFDYYIRLSKWVVNYEYFAKCVIRHELAHCVEYWQKQPQEPKQNHSRNFKLILKRFGDRNIETKYGWYRTKYIKKNKWVACIGMVEGWKERLLEKDAKYFYPEMNSANLVYEI